MSCLIAAVLLVCSAPAGDQTAIIVVGAPGEQVYADRFLESAALWQQACSRGNIRHVLIGTAQGPAVHDLTGLKQTLDAQARSGDAPIWLVLIGHGTYDGRSARFNLRGPDLTAQALVDWLGPFTRPVVLVNTASCSGPFLTALSGPNRVIVTATRSGFESSATRFNSYMAAAITDPNADLDKDGQTSLLEAFLVASRRTADSYLAEGRLATEHPLLDDNGDGLGTPADWYLGLRPVKRARQGAQLDGYRAHQLQLIPSQWERTLPEPVRARRDLLELEVIRLRDSRDQLSQQEYLDRLQPLLLELARIYLGHDLDKPE